MLIKFIADPSTHGPFTEYILEEWESWRDIPIEAEYDGEQPPMIPMIPQIRNCLATEILLKHIWK
jgi:hypothetical protein